MLIYNEITKQLHLLAISQMPDNRNKKVLLKYGHLGAINKLVSTSMHS